MTAEVETGKGGGGYSASTPYRGIPTTYAATRFRSRLEAHYAAFFDLIDWRWEYEPFDADGYIPDFLIQGRAPVLVEVKPVVLAGEYQAVAQSLKGKLLDWKHDVLVVGTSAVTSAFTDTHYDPSIGLLRDANWFPGEWAWDPGIWLTCRGPEVWERGKFVRVDPCGMAGIRSQMGSFRSRPCGHQDGDHHLLPASPRLETLWREAGNTVQWRK